MFLLTLTTVFIRIYHLKSKGLLSMSKKGCNFNLCLIYFLVRRKLESCSFDESTFHNEPSVVNFYC